MNSVQISGKDIAFKIEYTSLHSHLNQSEIYDDIKIFTDL